MLQRADYHVQHVGFLKTLRDHPPACFLNEALKYTESDMFYLKDHSHLKIFIFNYKPTGKKISLSTATAYHKCLAGDLPTLMWKEARRNMSAVDKAVDLLRDYVEVFISRTVPSDQRRGNSCTCEYWAKYGACYHVLVAEHLLGSIDLRVLLAKAFPANHRRGKGRKQQVTKHEPDPSEVVENAPRPGKKERFLAKPY